MPELPEVESTRRSLLPHVVGRVVARLEVVRADVVTSHLPEAQPTGFAPLSTGACLRAISRHGKDLALEFESPAGGLGVLVHLGMTGSLRYAPDAPSNPLLPHTHIVWHLRGGGTLRFRDPRRFGGLWLYPSVAAIAGERWASRGPDALSITARDLHRRLSRTARPLKAALLDQAVVAGLGNIYVDELLHACGLHPAAPAHGVSLADLQRVVRAMRRLLARAIDAGGSTIRDYVDGQGAVGQFQLRHAVYGRAGDPCRRCHTPLDHGTIGGRTTVWCGRCQVPSGI